MRSTCIALVFGLVSPSIAFADEEQGAPSEAPPLVRAPSSSPSESRPGVLVETAAVPAARAGWVNASGGATGGGRFAFDGAAMVSPIARIAIGAGVATTSEAASPWAGAYGQLLTQESAGVDMTTSVRVRAVAPEGSGGSQLVAKLNVGRAFGPTYVAVNGGVAQGLDTRADVDYEGGGVVFVRVARIARLGAEGRVRGELKETYVTAEDTGRPVEALGGLVAGVNVGRVLVQGLGGWSWPRGPLPSGPMAMGAATFAF